MADDLNSALFEVITHLVTSAPTSLEETPTLAAFRMVDAANRLMSLVEDGTTGGSDEFLQQARAEYQAHRDLVMTDQAAFETWLADYVRTFTREARSRASSPSSSAP